MRNTKRALAICLAVCLAMGLSSCKKEEGPTKEELMQDNAAYSALIDEQTAKIADLEKTLTALTGSDGPTLAITQVSDGSDKLGFNSILNKLLFPVAFEYPGATQAPAASKLQLDKGIFIEPSGNWVINVNGTTSQYSHSSGINGIIKVVAIPEYKQTTEINETVINPFIAAIPTTSTASTKIFFNNTEMGSMQTIGTTVDGEAGILKIAYFANSSRALTFCFFYGGESDATKNELVDSLIKSLQLGEQRIVME